MTFLDYLLEKVEFDGKNNGSFHKSKFSNFYFNEWVALMVLLCCFYTSYNLMGLNFVG